MNKIKILKMFLAMLPVVVALGLAPSVASAHGGFVKGGMGEIAKDGSGSCLHTVDWKSSMGKCPGKPMKKMAKCPGTPKGVPVDKKGCALDSDGDGVADYKDACPGTPRGNVVDARGCEKISKITVSGVNFDFDRATLKANGPGILDAAANKIIRNASGVKSVMVTGYTDSTGPEAYNKALSERRANTVKNYLEGKGVKGVAASGKGEADPVADNGTRAGRAANRRVEIDVNM